MSNRSIFPQQLDLNKKEKQTMPKLKHVYSKDGLSHYVADDDTWDGSDEDALRLPMVSVGYDLNTYEEDADPVEEFRKLGIEVER